MLSPASNRLAPRDRPQYTTTMSQPHPVSIRPDPATQDALERLQAAQPTRRRHDLLREALRAGVEALEGRQETVRDGAEAPHKFGRF